MNRPADAVVILRLISTSLGGKDRAIRSGYRPTYAVRDNYLTSVHHEFIGTDEIPPSGEAQANIWFITPEAYPHTLWPGQNLVVSEGSRKVGMAEVVTIFNEVLNQKNG